MDWPRAGRGCASGASVALPLLLISLVAAGSRGTTIAFVAGLGDADRADRRHRPGASSTRGQLGAILLAAAIVVPFVVPSSSIGRSLSAVVGSASGLSTNGRASLWSEGLPGLQDSTALFGVGTGGFGAIDPELLSPQHSARDGPPGSGSSVCSRSSP